MTYARNLCVSTLIAFLVFLLPSISIAGGSSKDEIRPLVEWVQVVGTPKTLHAELARALGIPTPNGADLTIVSKAYLTGNGVTYSFGLVNISGGRAVVLERFREEGNLYRGWRMSEEGTVIKTVVADGPNVTIHDGFTVEDEFRMVLKALLAKVPPEKSK